jgi:DNA polymerase (family 10)
MQKVQWKPQAYAKAALAVEDADQELSSLYTKGGIKALKTIPGIGQSIAEAIEELITTGKLAYYENLRTAVPVDVSGLSAIEGLGPKSIEKLYQALGIATVADLEKAAKAGKIRELKGFGAKAEERILKGLESRKLDAGRIILGKALPRVAGLEKMLREISGVEQVSIAGSIRRRKETIGDADILVAAANSANVMEAFVNAPGVARILAKGDTKLSVKLASGLQVDLRVVPPESWGAALQYFTGSKEHNVAVRTLAVQKGLKLNEHGLWRGDKMVAGRTEEDIYKALGMRWMAPELREDTGEVAASLQDKLPKVIGYTDLKGDLQVQTNWTDGAASIEEMALAAAARGLEYIAITDHTKRLAMTGGLDEKRILEQMKEIDAVNKKLKGKIVVLKGSECDILKDGSLDLPDDILKRLDVVGVSVHSHFKLPEAEQTQRVLKAIRNPHADIFFHPTGRLINKRDPIALDMDQIVRVAKETGMVLEANAYPDRLDLKDDHIRKAINAGVKISIDSDAHAPGDFALLEYGISQARRGWAEKKDVINAWPLEKMLSFIKK